MGLTENIISALREPLRAEYIRIEDDDGVSGFVVSQKFEEMSTLDRQRLIEDALRNAPQPLSKEQWRRILVIAGLTPSEYESVGARIRVHKIREQGDGAFEVLIRGGYSDAMYVLGTLKNLKDVQTSEPEQIPGALGILLKFQAKGTERNPLTRDMLKATLEANPYVQIVEDSEETANPS